MTQNTRQKASDVFDVRPGSGCLVLLKNKTEVLRSKDPDDLRTYILNRGYQSDQYFERILDVTTPFPKDK